MLATLRHRVSVEPPQSTRPELEEEKQRRERLRSRTDHLDHLLDDYRQSDGFLRRSR